MNPRMLLMGPIYLVRHAQASFGSDDYDRLSPLGWRQGQRLGEHLRAHGLHFDAVLTGTLCRHHETWLAIRTGWEAARDAQVWPGLDEYDSAALIEALNARRRGARTLPGAAALTSGCCATRCASGWRA